MKKRRLLLILLALLLVVGIPTGFIVHEYRQERLNRDLIKAIYAQDTNKALMALEAGANPNAKEEDRPSTPTESFQRLFDQIFHRGAQNGDYRPRTALMLTFENNSWSDGIAPENPELVSVLLDHSADPNIKGPVDRTPFTCAAIFHYHHSLRLLLAHHADPNARDKDGNTALNYAFMFLSKPELHSDPETIHLLIQYGADVNVQNNSGITPLMEAIRFDDNAAMVQALLEAHADVNRKYAGGTPRSI